MTALADALRRLALHQDIPECAQAADEIERLRGLVAEAHLYLALLLDRRDAAFRELLENSRQALNEKRGQS